MKRIMIIIGLCSLGAGIYAQQQYSCGPPQAVGMDRWSFFGEKPKELPKQPQVYNSLEECKKNCKKMCVLLPQIN